jgi:N-methylhydantoinase B
MSPITLEIYRLLFASVAEEMGTVLKKASYSPNIKERCDYSCAVFDKEGEVLAMGDHMPVHLGSMPKSVRTVLDEFPLRPGDIAILNDPFGGGTHLPDITMVLPVYGGDAKNPDPIFYVASRAHHADVGGMSPGSMPISSDVYQEGIRIPALLLYRNGELNNDLLRLLLHNVRTPVEREGDLAAQVASLMAGEKRLKELIQKNGVEELDYYSVGLQDYAERLMRGVISEIPDGIYTADDVLDDDGTPEKGKRARGIQISATIEVTGDSLRVDFDGTDSQVKGCVNAVGAVTYSASCYVMRCLAPPDTPSSAGLMRPVEVLIPERSVLNAEHPAATVGGNVETSQRVVDVLLKAFSAALPEAIPAASSGTMNNLSLGTIHPVSKQPLTYYETIGGGMGGGPAGPGDSGIQTHMTNSLNTPIEALEREFPIRVREYRLRSSSGGKGKHPGGDGVVRSIEALTECQVTILSERRRYAPYGLNGGRVGKKGSNYVIVRGRTRRLPSKTSVLVSPGDCVVIESPGGGGWGSASTRSKRPRSRYTQTRGRRPSSSSKRRSSTAG